MITGIKELDDQLLKLFENTHTCSLVCKNWKAVMDFRKSRIKTKLYNALVALVINKDLMITNYKQMPYNSYFDKTVRAVANSGMSLVFADTNVILGIKPEFMKAEHIKSISDIDTAIAGVGVVSKALGIKRLFKLCRKKPHDLIYIQVTTGVIVLVFEKQLLLNTNNNTYIYNIKGVNFIDYANGLIYFEFAGGIYETKDFKSVTFIHWIADE